VASRPMRVSLDLVRRRFKASRPGQLHVADFTYVPLISGRSPVQRS
jgi:transposase InsO family protein